MQDHEEWGRICYESDLQISSDALSTTKSVSQAHYCFQKLLPTEFYRHFKVSWGESQNITVGQKTYVFQVFLTCFGVSL